MFTALLPLAATLLPLPVPIAHWQFQPSRIRDGELVSVTGPNLKVSGFPIAKQGGLALKGPNDAFTYPWYSRDKWKAMPMQAFTIDLVALVRPSDEDMGLAGNIFMADEGLRGWTLNLEKGDIIFRVATPKGITTVRSPKPSRNTFLALTASYDQSQAALYVDGKLTQAAEAKLGAIELNGRTPFAVGGWWQGDITLGFDGIVRSYILFDRALTSGEVGELPSLRTQTLAPLSPRSEPDKLEFVLAPTIQLARTDEATIVWETNGTSTGEVRYGLDGALTSSVRAGSGRIHKVRLAGLQPGMRYSFQVVSPKAGGAKLEAPVSTFSTMPAPGQSLRFTVVGDTQEKPQINSQVAKGMVAQQPHFGMIVGDFVGAGWEKDQWVNEFFASMHPLWSKTPLVQVLGNHDRNAMIYYDQMALPKPYYCYSFRAGDAEIFSIDTGHSVQPGSEQYRWLEDALRRSTAKWKIVAHHYPPYSSDLDDYGTDLGDVEVRTLCVLYDRYNVDLVFSGHIHSYERHKPLRNGKPDPNGVTYVVVGGGGGDLEQFLPNPPDYSVVRKTTHHYGVVDVIGDTLMFRAYNLAGNRIDAFEIKK